MNEPDSGPERDGLQCRSCGQWHGGEHHAGCPLRGALSVSVNTERAAPVVAKPAPVVVEPPKAPEPTREDKPKRKRRAKASE